MSKNHAAAGDLGGLVMSRVDTKVGRAVLHAGLNMVFGLLCSRAVIFGDYAPFGVAAVAAGSGSGSLFMLIGVTLGYLMPAGAQYPAKYIAAAAAVFALKWLFSGFKSFAGRTAANAAFASVCLLVTSMAIVINDGMRPASLVYSLAETLLCGCSVLFLRRAVPLLRTPSKMWGLSQQQLICVTISLCILLLSLEGIGAGGISLGRVLGIIVVLIAARYGREAGGCITGVAVGIIMSLGDKGMVHILAGYGFGGLLTGVFSPLGRFACAAAFILANSMAGLYMGGLSQVVTGLYEVMIATVIFMLLPERLLCRISSVFVPASREQSSERMRTDVSTRLFGAAGVLEEISQTMSELTTHLRRLNRGDVSCVFDEASESVCRHCGMKIFCWETAYNDTMGVFNDMTEKLKSSGELTRDDVPPHFAVRCCKLSDLLRGVNQCYAGYLARKSGDERADRLRGVLSEQYTSIAGLLRDIAGGFSATTQKEFAGGERIRSAFAVCGLDAGSSACRMDSRGRVTVEAQVAASGRGRVSRRELVNTLSGACGRHLGEPSVIAEGGVLKVSLTEKPEFTARFGQASIARSGEQLCGDTCESFLSSGHAYMIMSDGMGCGGGAAVDSNLTAGLMSRMLHAGFGFDTAMSVVNSAMILKSDEESFATLDIASIDLFTGEAEFFKAGAPPTYLRRSGRVERIAQNSMPAGILQGTKLERSASRLRSGDLVVLLSDGALNGDDAWLVHEMEVFDGSSVRSFAGHLTQKAKELRTDGHEDDITVLAAVIS
ncbi:MAG: SpoIIE family protein phosphatase [Clostridia bacterium]|nr:SpoIIE family protein phosphatase [Clostridia bacterium]MDR3645214.1 SpoIIE family protein phosphatase [Clostridia bacterium]